MAEINAIGISGDGTILVTYDQNIFGLYSTVDKELKVSIPNTSSI